MAGVAGVISKMTSRPPGCSTRAISAIAARVVGHVPQAKRDGDRVERAVGEGQTHARRHGVRRIAARVPSSYLRLPPRAASRREVDADDEGTP